MIYFNHDTKTILDKDDGEAATKKYPDSMRGYLPTHENQTRDWKQAELKWISEEIELKADGNKRARGNTMAELRAYRNAVKDYESGEKPSRPE